VTRVDDFITAASQQIGDPYVFGDEGPGSFDCSGLIQYCLGLVGIKSPRVARAQQDWVSPIPKGSRQPGDLIFWGDPATHVALYVGNGKMISAPGTGKRVHMSSAPNSNVTYGRIPGLGAGTAGPLGEIQNAALLGADWAAGAKDVLVIGGAVTLGLGLLLLGGWQGLGAQQLQRARTQMEGLLQ
jgi:hypothetical protein